MHGKSTKKPPYIWSAWVVFITVVAGLFLAWLSSRLMIDELVKRGMAKIYAPVLSLTYKTAGQKSITVVTIDDTDLKNYGLSWPVPLDYYQRVIDALTKRQAKAIFLDILFIDDKPEKELHALADAACRATEAGIPFFLATFARESLTSNSERMLFAARNSAGTPCVIPVQSNISPDALEQSQWSYPLRFKDPQATKSENENPPVSVALTIYCQLYKGSCPEQSQVPLALIWGSRAAPTNVEIMVERNRATGGLEPVCRGQWNWWEVLPGASMLYSLAINANMLPVCPYNQVLPVRALKGKGFSAEELDAAISGKIVLIGADLKAVGDNVFSPLHGRLPGVHVHAMALDNLISFDGQYKENGDFDLHDLLNTKANQFVLLSITLIAIVMVPWKPHKKRKIENSGKNDEFPEIPKLKGRNLLIARAWIFIKSPLLILTGVPKGYSSPKEKHDFWLEVKETFIFICLGGIILIMGYGLFSQGPLSIIEYILFSLMAHFLHVGETIAERIKHAWEAFWSLNPTLEWAKKEKEYSDENKH